jgi:flagellar M-ring protein FliF
VTSFTDTWKRTGPSVKVGIAFGIVAIAVVTIWLGLWAYRAEYQVLFADISSRDAAAMTAELDRMKIPYQLSDSGNTILVQKDMVYKTRLKLMEKDVPLHGAVGFEVFNNADFGMTEFVQKVNYQRALQGELTRTILSIDNVQSVRVHLAVPDQGLFKKAVTKSKASVTVTMKPGKILGQDQVAGIQRLVAASVPDIVPTDVTVLDQHGVALTRNVSADADSGADAALGQFDSKRSTEEYLVRKVNLVLDRTFGTGEAIASVDVVLNLDQSRVTTEEVLPAKHGVKDAVPTGVVVRERQTTRENGGGTSSTVATPSKEGMSSLESDYQVGRRVEQIVTAPGTMRRLTIAVVVRKPLTDAQLQKLKEVVGLAAGFNSQRGDAVVVYSMDRLAGANPDTAANPLPGSMITEAANDSIVSQHAAQSTVERAQVLPKFIVWAIALTLVVILLLWGLYMRFSGTGRQAVQRRLSDAEREQVLVKVRQWIHTTTVSQEPVGNRK